MSRLDDAGMDRPDRNLVQALALRRQERIGGPFGRRRDARAERILNIPKTEIEPRPCVGRAERLQSIEAVNGALESDRRRMQRTDRRKGFLRTFEADDD